MPCKISCKNFLGIQNECFVILRPSGSGFVSESFPFPTKKTFTQLIEEKILKYKGWKAEDLYDAFDVPVRSKSKNSLLIRKMIGITGDLENTQEFQKANMNLRVIRVNQDDLPKEDSPFKVYDFIELAQNDNWEESHVFQEICDKRYMFVVFKEEASGEYVLNQVKFWGFPERLIDEKYLNSSLVYSLYNVKDFM